MLVDRGAVAPRRDAQGLTQLMWAVVGGNPDVVEFLIERGADVNAVDNEGRSVLDHALEMRREGIATMLREHGARARYDEMGRFGPTGTYPPAWDPPFEAEAAEAQP